MRREPSSDPVITRLTVLPEWIDHPGHLNVACYVLTFDLATDALYERWGVGEEYPARRGCSRFTLGMGVDYVAWLFEGDAIRIASRLLDYEHRRAHYLHRMFRVDRYELASVNECLAMNNHVEPRRSAPLPDDVQRRLVAVHIANATHPAPEGAGRRLRIRRR